MYKGNDTDDTSILAEFLCLSFRKVCIGIHENITPEKLIRMSYAVYISNLQLIFGPLGHLDKNKDTNVTETVEILLKLCHFYSLSWNQKILLKEKKLTL